MPMPMPSSLTSSSLLTRSLQFEGRFQSKRLNNWEYPRFSPPRPRGLQKNAKVVAANNGHLLPEVIK